MKVKNIALFTTLLVIMLAQSGAPVHAETITGTAKFGVNKGDVFTSTVTKLDSGFDTSTFDSPVKKGDHFTLEILQDVNSVDMEIDTDFFETYSIVDTGQNFKYTYPNGSSEITPDGAGLLYPISGTLSNGSSIDLIDFVRLDFGFFEPAITETSSSITVGFNFIYSVQFTISKTTGVITKETVTDAGGHQLVIEEGSGSSDKPSLPFSMGSAILGIGVAVLAISVIRKRKFT